MLIDCDARGEPVRGRAAGVDCHFGEVVEGDRSGLRVAVRVRAGCEVDAGVLFVRMEDVVRVYWPIAGAA